MRRWLYAVLGAALALAVAAGVAALYVDRIARIAIERGGSYALGVETRVGSARIGLLSGRFGLSDLAVANPSGFDTPTFLTLERGSAAIELSTLRQGPIVIERVELAGIGLTLERAAGGTNYDAILRNLERLSAGTAEGEAADATAVIVRELVIRDVGAAVRLAPGGELTQLDVEIPEIRLTDLGASSPSGIELAELTSVVTRAILQAVASQSGALPRNVAAALRQRLSRLGGLGVPGAAEAGERVGREIEERLGRAGEEAQQALEGLRGLLGDDD